MEGLLEEAARYLEMHPSRTVKTLVVEVGRDSSYSVESLQQAFTALRKGTRLEHARLVLEITDGSSVILRTVVLK